MISILDRYIAKTIIITSLFVTAVLMALNFFLNLLGEFRDIGTGDYGFSQALVHVFLNLPHDLYQFFPMLMLLGGVLGLGILSSHHELVVMRASGVSLLRIVRAVIIAAIVLVIAATIIGEGIGPRAVFLADKHKQSAENGGQAVATASGVWIHEGNNFLHVDRVMGHKHLEGVKRYEFDNQHRLLAAYYVKSLDFQDGQWQLHQLAKTTFANDHTYSEIVDKGTWNLTMNPSLLDVGLVEPKELSLVNLAKYSQHLAENGQNATRFEFEFWKRIFQPITTLVMVLLAIPFVFVAPRSVSMGKRILLGVIIGFVFYIMNAFLGQFSVVFQITPWVAAILPTLLFSVVVAGLMWRL